MRLFRAAFVILGSAGIVLSAHVQPVAARAVASVAGGIREEISGKDKVRYDAWKEAFLSAETGLREWQTYAQDPRLQLTIAMSTEERHGASIGNYAWDSSGHLVAATITLGVRLDEGYPGPVYYPVMNALEQDEFRFAVGPGALAATKIAHEFGHLNHMVATDAEVYRLQSELVPSYNSIMRRNGWNDRDPRLVALARRMGGTPVEIWEDREYWGEANAMLYLRDRVTDGALRCSLFSYIIRNVDTYAKVYRTRFAQIAQSPAPPKSCTVG